MPETTRRPLIEVAQAATASWPACPAGGPRTRAGSSSLGSISYLGSHGSEVLRPGAIAPELDRELQAWTRRVQAFAHEAFGEKLRRLRVRLEDKEAIAALHWRGVPDEEDALAAVERGGRGGRGGRLRRPLGPQGAGDPAARADRQGRRDRRACCATPTWPPRVYVGDDITDLDAFRGLTELQEMGRLGYALRVGVRSDEGPSALQRRRTRMVEGPDGVRELLRRSCCSECASATSSRRRSC